jgi:Zn-dependent protease
MASTNPGSIHLFRFAGIDVFLHWSWFLVALIEIQIRRGRYTSITWNALEYLALFLIVLLHEFGHAMACRQVGGTANRIVLWPLGGVAYVDPPLRPGAMLWSITAGPLVNVALLPVFWTAVMMSRSLEWALTMPDAYMLVHALFWINLSLLIFNLLPIYPLDGGKILQSLLWFPLGRARSLMTVTILSFVGIVAFFGLAVLSRSVWTAVIAVFMLMNCWGGLQQARALLRIAKMPRRKGFACPSCRTAPLLGELWQCAQCNQAFDTFQTGGVCPHCGAQYPTTMCGDCGRSYSMNEWAVGYAASSDAVNSGFLER